MESNHNNEVRAEVARRLTHPITLVGFALLAWELLIALVVIFSRMSAGFQFLCVLLMAVPMLAIVGVALRTAFPQRANQLDQSAVLPIVEGEPIGNHEALNLVSRLEELADNTRRFPLNITTGFDDEQFTYTTVKLRAAVQNLLTDVPAIAESAPSNPAMQPAAPIEPPQPHVPLAAIPLLEAETPTEPVAEEIPAELVAAGAELVAEAVTPEPADEIAAPEIAEAAKVPEPVEQTEATEPAAEVAAPNPVAEQTEVEPLPEPEPEDLGGASDDPTAAITAAREALRRRDSDEAIRLLTSINRAAEASELLGIAYELAGNRPAALDALKVAIQTESDRASAHFNYAVILAKEQRLDEAAREAQRALELNPDYTSARDFVRSLDRPREILLR